MVKRQGRVQKRVAQQLEGVRDDFDGEVGRAKGREHVEKEVTEGLKDIQGRIILVRGFNTSQENCSAYVLSDGS